MIVVLGAEWCPACVILKQQTIPEAQRRGALQKVELTHVNIDKQKAVAAKLLKGRQIPQMIRMEWLDSGGWAVTRFKGVPGVEGVQQFARTETAKQKKPTRRVPENRANLLVTAQ